MSKVIHNSEDIRLLCDSSGNVARRKAKYLEIKTNIYYTAILAIDNKSVTNLYIQCFVEVHIYKMIFVCSLKYQ